MHNIYFDADGFRDPPDRKRQNMNEIEGYELAHFLSDVLEDEGFVIEAVFDDDEGWAFFADRGPARYHVHAAVEPITVYADADDYEAEVEPDDGLAGEDDWQDSESWDEAEAAEAIDDDADTVADAAFAPGDQMEDDAAIAAADGSSAPESEVGGSFDQDALRADDVLVSDTGGEGEEIGAPGSELDDAANTIAEHAQPEYESDFEADTPDTDTAEVDIALSDDEDPIEVTDASPVPMRASIRVSRQRGLLDRITGRKRMKRSDPVTAALCAALETRDDVPELLVAY